MISIDPSTKIPLNTKKISFGETLKLWKKENSKSKPIHGKQKVLEGTKSSVGIKSDRYNHKDHSVSIFIYENFQTPINDRLQWWGKILENGKQMNNCRNFSKLLRQIFPPSSAEIPYTVALNSSNYSIFQNKPDYQRANSSITDANVPSETGHTHRSCCWPKA
jgi:hypothetical protein